MDADDCVITGLDLFVRLLVEVLGSRSKDKKEVEHKPGGCRWWRFCKGLVLQSAITGVHGTVPSSIMINSLTRGTRSYF